jgi:ABC-type phosphate transport system substrate-binding protein
MTTWKDKRIDAMNRKIKAYPKASKARTEYYLDEYYAVISSEATNKQQYKMEQKAKQRGFIYNDYNYFTYLSKTLDPYQALWS